MALIYGIAGSERELLNKYPSTVQKIGDIEKVHENLKEQMEGKHDGFFGRIRKWNKQRQLDRFEKNKDNPMHAGAHSELSVLNELSKLPDNYHVLCGLDFELPYYVTYKGQRNLKSAQMDFVVTARAHEVKIAQ